MNTNNAAPKHETRPHAAFRLPADAGLRFFILFAIFFVLICLCMEAFWRYRGFLPSVTDGEDLWAMERDRLEGADEHTLLILGRSRIQQAFRTEVLRKRYPAYRPIQLAIGGKHPLATLRDIAENTNYAGLVLVSITSPGLLPECWEQQASYLRYYHENWGPLKKNARRVKNLAQSRCAFFAPELALQEAGPDLLRGGPPPQFLRTLADRSQQVDYHQVDLAAFTETQLKKITHNINHYITLDGYKNWPSKLQRIDDWVRRIQGRGGKVLFLRCPTTGAYHEVETAHFPRTKYWDRFVKSSSAWCLHFEDVPALAALECAEGTHLHLEDTVRFTETVLDLLAETGWLY